MVPLYWPGSPRLKAWVQEHSQAMAVKLSFVAANLIPPRPETTTVSLACDRCQEPLDLSRMSLCQLIVSKAGKGPPYGYFVIDTPVTSQSQILDSLTERDKGQICYRLGVTSAYPFTPAIPPNVAFQLFSALANPLHFTDRPAAFTTENGFPVWINRGEN